MPWGKPDFDTTQTIDIDALHAQILREDATAIVKWPFEGPAGFDHATVKRYCVDTTHNEVADWQRVRLSMKGKKTHEKLAILMRHYEKGGGTACDFGTHVQVYNYLGALRRGGQLDDQNRIRKYI